MSERSPLFSNERHRPIVSRVGKPLVLVMAFVLGMGCLTIFSTSPIHVFKVAESSAATSYASLLHQGPDLTPAAHADFIADLPGLPYDCAMERQFSGYLNLSNGGQLHYWLVESQNSPSSDPVALWLNGGPGASSLGGLLNENGPFLVNDDGVTLRRNPFSWNRKANMLYIESPIGVGFSYNSSGQYISGDFLQAKENYEGLQLFFQRFPYLRSNEFFVTGESYGGVYVPTLTREIVQGNQNSNNNLAINLVGFAVGNGVNEYSVNSQMFFAYYHGLFGASLWQKLRQACPSLQEFAKPNFNFFDLASNTNASNVCAKVRAEAFTSMMSAHINSYDIYRKCNHGNPDYGINEIIKQLVPSSTYSESVGPAAAQPMGLPISLCLNTTAGTTYLNRDSVKAALHVPSHLSWSDIVMTNVSTASFKALNLTLDKPVLHYGMPLQSHVIDIWSYLLDHGVRGVIYHGDVDFMCDFIGGQWALDSMNMDVTIPYQPWAIMGSDGVSQTGGFIKAYSPDMTFLTVKGAGHMVPQWKPSESLHMFERFVTRTMKNQTMTVAQKLKNDMKLNTL